MIDRWHVTREVESDCVNYTVRWSPWGSMDRWVINRLVPSEAGLFQLWVNDGREFGLLLTELTFFGGLRNTLREIIDDLAPAGEVYRRRIADRECWFRFTVCPFREYLENLQNWFSRDQKAQSDDELEVLVHEIDTQRKFAPPPPDVKFVTRGRMKDSDFGPPMPLPITKSSK